MDAGARSPAEPKQGDRGQDGANDCDTHALLRFDLAVFVVHLLLDVVNVGEVKWEGDKDPAQDAEECETKHLLPEVVDFDEHDGERLEPEVEQCVDEPDVEVEYKDNGLLEIERERPDQYIDRDIASS